MENAKWIWAADGGEADEYVKFYETFSARSAILKISADSNYAAYVNGKLAAFGQYADYPHFKVYDEIDLTAYLKDGENKLVVVCWYYGVDTSTYVKNRAGLIYEVISPDNFREFCLPCYQRAMKEFHRMGTDVYLHICGNSAPLFEMMADTGVNAIEPLDPLGGVSVADAKKRVGDRVCLKGGVNTLTFMNGTTEDVERETRAVLEQGMAGGEFLLGSGDDFPRESKPENIKTFVETAHKYGKYPVKK